MSVVPVRRSLRNKTDPETSVSAGSTEGNAKLEKATCKVTRNADGTYTALAYYRTKDGKEAYCKMQAKVRAFWSDSRSSK